MAEWITKRQKIEILTRAYDRPVTARNFANIIYEIGTHPSYIFGELNFLTDIGEMKKEGTPSQYYYSLIVKQPTPRYYYVFQGRSFDEECKDGFLWAPRNGNNGPAKHHWSRMGEVKKGDVILHGNQGYLFAANQELARFLLDATAGMTDFDEHIRVIEVATDTATIDTTDFDDEMELEVFEINDNEDKKLINDLNQAPLSNGQDYFEYEDGAKEKPDAIYVNGHKTYPRDRQTAVNALAYAH